MNKRTMSPYTPLNNTKTARGSMYSYKSPNIVGSKFRYFNNHRRESLTSFKSNEAHDV